MESSSKAVKSSFFKKKIAEAKEEVASGRTLSSVFAEQKIYPDHLHIKLSPPDKNQASSASSCNAWELFFERDVDNFMKRVVALAEPMLLLFIGMLIAFIVVAIMGPIFRPDYSRKIGISNNDR